ncbi:hypothetical protein [Flavobacterium sp.]|uniref:hypothetical protein n=1 Tax=Flavobacterium sp. TaxID=239 RepID=UPI003D0A8145
MIRSKSDFLERDIEKLTLLLRKLFEKVVKTPLAIDDLQQTIVFNDVTITLEELLKGTLEEFKNKVNPLPVVPKEFVLKILHQCYHNKTSIAEAVDLKEKIQYLLTALDEETKVFSLERSKIKENLN